jgi:hypothetical protein
MLSHRRNVRLERVEAAAAAIVNDPMINLTSGPLESLRKRIVLPMARMVGGGGVRGGTADQSSPVRRMTGRFRFKEENNLSLTTLDIFFLSRLCRRVLTSSTLKMGDLGGVSRYFGQASATESSALLLLRR